MSWYRCQAQARLEDGMTEGRVGGGFLQLVTVLLETTGWSSATSRVDRVAPEPPVVSYLRPSEARSSRSVFWRSPSSRIAAWRSAR